jgi:hypothetical protein
MKPSKRPKSRLSLWNEPFVKSPFTLNGFIRLLPFLLNNFSLDCRPLDFEGPSLGRRKGLMGEVHGLIKLIYFFGNLVLNGYLVRIMYPFRSVSNQWLARYQGITHELPCTSLVWKTFLSSDPLHADGCSKNPPYKLCALSVDELLWNLLLGVL